MDAGHVPCDRTQKQEQEVEIEQKLAFILVANMEDKTEPKRNMYY